MKRKFQEFVGRCREFRRDEIRKKIKCDIRQVINLEDRLRNLQEQKLLGGEASTIDEMRINLYREYIVVVTRLLKNEDSILEECLAEYFSEEEVKERIEKFKKVRDRKI